jgi:hypothetical protein
MIPWVLLAGGLVILLLAGRIASRRSRGITQGCGVLLAAIGGLLLLRRRGQGLTLPGDGPRRWRQP